MARVKAPVPDHLTPEVMSSPAYQIFKGAVTVRMRQAYAKPRSDIELYGSYSSGINEIDAINANTEVMCVKSIWQLAELHRNGVEITILNPQTVIPAIYDLIDDHLQDVADSLNNLAGTLSTRNVMDEDTQALISEARILEKFAKVLYHMAADFIKQSTNTATISSMLSSSLMSRTIPVTVHNHHPDAVDLLESRLTSRTRSRLYDGHY